MEPFNGDIDELRVYNRALSSSEVNQLYASESVPPTYVSVDPANVSIKLCPNVVIQGTVGRSYIIQSSTNLADTNDWITMTNITLTQPIQYWNDISDESTKSQRYYRVLHGQ